MSEIAAGCWIGSVGLQEAPKKYGRNWKNFNFLINFLPGPSFFQLSDVLKVLAVFICMLK